MTARKRTDRKAGELLPGSTGRHRSAPSAQDVDDIRAARLPREPLKSTVLIPHDGPSRELLAFVSCIGSPMNGGGDEHLVCTSGDTNMRTMGCLVDEPMQVRELWFEIPRIAEARFQIPLPCGTRNPFRVGADEMGEIIGKTQLSFYVGGDKPIIRQMLSSFLLGPEVPASAALRFHHPVRPTIDIGRIERFWVELNWPNGTPQFKPICPNSRVYPRIPVAIYLVP